MASANVKLRAAPAETQDTAAQTSRRTWGWSAIGWPGSWAWAASLSCAPYLNGSCLETVWTISQISPDRFTAKHSVMFGWTGGSSGHPTTRKSRRGDTVSL